MKQLNRNRYLREFKFLSSDESKTFFNNQETQKRLYIEDTFGENYYCYICYHALTKEKQFILAFSSDDSLDSLNFLFWNDMLVLDTGKNIYFIDDDLNIKGSLEITTPLIGLYLINDKRLLLLEEAYLRVVDSKGYMIKSELFDLIEDFSIKDNLLSIRTNEENKVIELT